jgi:beta-aspartyl-peptidase (threonine type)
MNTPAYPMSRLRILLAVALIGLAVWMAVRVRERGKKSDEQVREAVSKVLDDQVEAWNRGDLDGFMKGYWQSEQLTFFSGGEVQQGWQETYDCYLKTYKTERKEVGTIYLLGELQGAQGLAPVAGPAGVLAYQLAAVGVVQADPFSPEMGTLTFGRNQITPTGPKSAVVLGRWRLTFKERPPIGGLFTLLFREEPQGWCIVHDHTSKAPPDQVPLPPRDE